MTHPRLIFYGPQDTHQETGRTPRSTGSLFAGCWQTVSLSEAIRRQRRAARPTPRVVDSTRNVHDRDLQLLPKCLRPGNSSHPTASA